MYYLERCPPDPSSARNPYSPAIPAGALGETSTPPLSRAQPSSATPAAARCAVAYRDSNPDSDLAAPQAGGLPEGQDWLQVILSAQAPKPPQRDQNGAAKATVWEALGRSPLAKSTDPPAPKNPPCPQ